LRCFHCENTAKKFQKNALVKNGGVGHFFWAGVKVIVITFVQKEKLLSYVALQSESLSSITQ
jgi:hypothetical protein